MANPITKPRALRFVRDAQRMLNTAEAKATDMATRRDQAVAEAAGAGATYGEIREATGLSTTRLTQILRRVRGAA